MGHAKLFLLGRVHQPCFLEVLPDKARNRRALCRTAISIVTVVLAFGCLQASAFAQETGDDGEHLRPKAEAATSPVLRTRTHASRFAVAFKSSTLGLGADVGTRITNHLNLRIGVNGFNYSRTVPDGDIAYAGSLRLRSIQALIDWFPWSGSLHVSPGLLVYDGNRVTANALIPTGKTLTSGAEVFVSNPGNPITGSAKSTMRQVAPAVLFGFGNLVSRKRHFGFSVDAGIVFQGQPTASFTLLGSACDVSGVHCRNVAADKSIQADIRSGEKTLQDDLSIFKYYPLISVEFGYRF